MKTQLQRLGEYSKVTQQGHTQAYLPNKFLKQFAMFNTNKSHFTLSQGR